jgi:hypothetical protein
VCSQSAAKIDREVFKYQPQTISIEHPKTLLPKAGPPTLWADGRPHLVACAVTVFLQTARGRQSAFLRCHFAKCA